MHNQLRSEKDDTPRENDNELISDSRNISQLISIVVPIHNAEQTLEGCLDSLVNQTYQHLEIILIDDGSNDGTASIIERYRAGDKRIKSLHIQNSGVSAARNRGIVSAHGKFIFFIDADDTIHLETIRLLYQAHLKSGSPLVIGGFERFNPGPMNSPDSVVFGNDRSLSMADITLYVFKYLSAPNKHPLFVTSWGRLILTDTIRQHSLRFDESMRTMEDVHFNFRFLSLIDSAYYVAQRLYNYRIYTTASSATTLSVKHPEGVLGFAPALECARRFLAQQCDDAAWVNRWVSHAYVTYTIVHLIRLCLQLNLRNFSVIYRSCVALIEAPQLDDCLVHYSPTGMDSRVIPFLMRRKQVVLIMLVSKYKAWRRYGHKNQA